MNNHSVAQQNLGFIAHVRSSDHAIQPLADHLFEVAHITKKLATKIGVPEAGELIGLLHDLGKYTGAFQTYLQSGTGLIDPDSEDYVNAASQKGKIDHSSAGAQWLWQELRGYGKNGEGALCGQILALCIASHHSGLIDCLQPDGTNGFDKRIKKSDELTHLCECQEQADPAILERAGQLAAQPLLQAMLKQIRWLFKLGQPGSKTVQQVYLGLWTRFLFSCLIDADRISSADFENPANATHRDRKAQWPIAINRLEFFLGELAAQADSSNKVNALRQHIADTCQRRAQDPQGIYSLTVPTGGGKTYASLRYALHHAQAHCLERIIYVIPYTSIIEQNAQAIRHALERVGEEYPWVLEHHSNLEPENSTWHSKLATENWDAPIVLTTMVQFLETLFSGGTRGVRRMHQLAGSVIIFDEIQTLPVNCTHLFCNALNFLASFTKATVVLCTATQPLLDNLKAPEKGQLNIPKGNELIDDVSLLFQQLKRVDIKDKTKPQGWSEQEIADLALAEFKNKGSCLVIVNTKAWAQTLYQQCAGQLEKTVVDESLFHLSTHQCPAHRVELLKHIKSRLNEKLPVLCFSTQLIEAGVDIDFASVIRFLAGLDSIAQAAGRCNRNGRQETAIVHIVNPTQETIGQLLDIKIGREKARRVLGEVAASDILSPETMALYFKYYFYERADCMGYPLTAEVAGRTDSLLSLLGNNDLNTHPELGMQLRQSFMTAGKAFKAIDAPTQAIIVPYQQGKDLITELCGLSAKFDAARYYDCLKQAQKYSVNVFPQVLRKLFEQHAVYEIGAEGVFYLDERYYHEAFGLSEQAVGKLEANIL